MTRRAVVAGGGVAGLLAAAAAASEFDEVVVVDHRLDGDLVTAAQAAQLHNVLTRGQRHLEELLPGFRAALLATGAQEGSVSDHTHVFEAGGPAAERPLGLSIWSTPLALLWSTARSLLPGHIQLRSGQVLGLTQRAGLVDTAWVRDSAGRQAELPAVAVVDATGYSTDAAAWLAGAGVSVPPVTERRLDRWHVTVRLSRPQQWRGAPDFWMTFTDAPERHAALLSPAGVEEWILLVASQDGSRPPTDLAGIGDFLDRLPGTPLRPLVDGSSVLSPLSLYRRRSARWRHYEQLEAPLGGFVAVGDSYSTVNPIFGTGVSVAAWEAGLLRDAWRAETDVRSWTSDYLSRAGSVVAQAWGLEDIPVPALSLPQWLRLAPALGADADLHRRYVGIWHLVEPTSAIAELGAAAEQG